MNDRWLISSFTASSLIHLALISAAALFMQAKTIKPVTVPIELLEVGRVEDPKKVEVPPPPAPKPKDITAPKLLSKPALETKPLQPPASTTKEEVKEKAIEPPPAPLPDNAGSASVGWNLGSKASEAEGSAAGPGNLFGRGDTPVVAGSGVEGGGGGTGNAGLGLGAKGDGTGGSSEALSSTARPLGGYQVKPRYPESARRAGVQGVTTLRVRVLENGRVGDVLVEQSAGFRDLDTAAADAVKKWLFEPARRGKDPVSVWVLLPVKFELH